MLLTITEYVTLMFSWHRFKLELDTMLCDHHHHPPSPVHSKDIEQIIGSRLLRNGLLLHIFMFGRSTDVAYDGPLIHTAILNSTFNPRYINYYLILSNVIFCILMTVLLLFTKIYYKKIIFICTSFCKRMSG